MNHWVNLHNFKEAFLVSSSPGASKSKLGYLIISWKFMTAMGVKKLACFHQLTGTRQFDIFLR